MSAPADRGTARLTALIAEARTRAARVRQPVIVALVEPVSGRDPLDALDAVARVAEEDPALSTSIGTDRMYWSEPGAGLSLAGFGAAATLTGRGPERFAEIEHAWNALRAAAVIDDPSDGERGVGPLLLGGASFQEAAPDAGWWSGFPPALFFLPRLQLAARDGECWMTTIVPVDVDGRCDLPLERLARLRRAALESPPAAASRATGHSGALSFSDARPADEWRAVVRRATSAIASGAMDKVVLARAVDATATAELNASLAVRQLRASQPECYVFAFWRGGRAFVGASPERLVRLDGTEVRASSLAGSIRRGANAAEDEALVARLLASAKDRDEESVVRQSLESMLRELCDHVSAPDLPTVLTLPQVHHLITPVVGRLREGHSLPDLLARLHPTPAVGGAPRDAAMRFIREHEELDRGWYASPIGWIGGDGGEFAVALRSALIAGRRARLFAGCGVMATSDADAEYEESLLKLQPMQRALGAALAGEAPVHGAPRQRASALGEHAR